MKRRIHIAGIVTLCLLLACFTSIAQEGRIVRETVYSPSLEGNLLGDSPNRSVTIYLPPSYDTSPEMAYPVVYLLHGYTGNNELWMGGSYISGNILNSMKSWLSTKKVREMILVMPNSYNKLQGSFYTNSAATGKWADYIAKDLVSYVDKKYRTLPQSESRAVIGHSMGGYGGMTLGMDYPDVFSCMGSMAGPIDMTQLPVRISWNYAQGAKLKNFSDFYSQDLNTRIAIAWSAAVSPNLDKLPFNADFPWEFDKSNNLIKNPTVWDKFMARDVLSRLSKNIGYLLKMKTIYVDCGTNDEFGIISDARNVHEELKRLGIEHFYKEFSGDHTCCVMTSTGDALEVFSNAMAFEMLVGVEPAGKLAATWGKIRSR